MDGIERIAARIREDAEQEIARMNQEATEPIRKWHTVWRSPFLRLRLLF